MPVIMIRGADCDRPLKHAVRAIARQQATSESTAAAQLIREALDARHARSRGAAAVNARRSATERSDAARRAVQARWARAEEKTG